MDWQGKNVVVTGASSGIGEQFARSIAARGGRPVLVARRLTRLEEVASNIRAEHEIPAIPIELDLGQPDAGGRLSAMLQSHGVTTDALINNAGFATQQAFEQEDPQRIAEEVAVNVAAVVGITRALLPDILAGGSGAVVNIASTAAFQPIPSMAVYGASKAFVLSFTEALWGSSRAPACGCWRCVRERPRRNSSASSATAPVWVNGKRRKRSSTSRCAPWTVPESRRWSSPGAATP